jgi:hypothetical protein
MSMPQAGTATPSILIVSNQPVICAAGRYLAPKKTQEKAPSNGCHTLMALKEAFWRSSGVNIDQLACILLIFHTRIGTVG